MIENLEKLWSLTGKSRSSFPDSENPYYDPVGLILLSKLDKLSYWCTPENSATFAKTGGDGVHFGFLLENGEVYNDSPVIMTLPCADTANIVVGENLLDFLSLGCRGGYFELEQIEFRPLEHIPFLDSKRYPSEMDQDHIGLLKGIEKEFDLTPWSNHSGRLAELKLKHYGRLKYSAEYYEITT